MYIDSKYKVRNIAGKNIIILQGQWGADTTKVLELNGTSFYLWNSFKDKADFTQEDVVRALIENYKIDAELSKRDAKQWVDYLAEFKVIVM